MHWPWRSAVRVPVMQVGGKGEGGRRKEREKERDTRSKVKGWPLISREKGGVTVRNQIQGSVVRMNVPVLVVRVLNSWHKADKS